MTCLLGDTDIFTLYRELASKKFNYQDLLAESEILSNLYYHQIRDGAQALRIPTSYCSKAKLASLGLDSKMETLINLCVSTAKKAIERASADILILGVIGATELDITKKEQCETFKKEVAETAIYLADFGVDAIVIESNCWNSLRTSILTVQEQSSQPLAPFLPFASLTKQNLADYLNLYSELELELLGFVVEPADLKNFTADFLDKIAKIRLGLAFQNWQKDSTNLDLNALLKNTSPVALFAGSNTARVWWNNFGQQYFG